MSAQALTDDELDALVAERRRTSRAKPRGRPVKWTEDAIIEAFQAYHARTGKQPTARMTAKGQAGLPNVETVYRVFDTWSNACVAAGLEGLPPGAWNRKDEETAVLVERVRAGAKLVDLGRELGISGQAVGRRVRRYCRAFEITPPPVSKSRRRAAANP